MNAEEIEKQIEHISQMRTYTDEQQIAKVNALGLWQIALHLAKMEKVGAVRVWHQSV